MSRDIGRDTCGRYLLVQHLLPALQPEDPCGDYSPACSRYRPESIPMRSVSASEATSPTS